MYYLYIIILFIFYFTRMLTVMSVMRFCGGFPMQLAYCTNESTAASFQWNWNVKNVKYKQI